MKRILAVCIACLFCSALVAGEPTLTKEDRAKAVKFLRDSEKELMDSVAKLTPAQWNYKPGPDRWSVAEVAEHIMLSEDLLFETVKKALAEKQNPEWKAKTTGKDTLVERALLNRERKAQAPERLKPQGKWTPAEILSNFKERRARTLKFIQETDLPMKAHTLDHPFPVFGTLNAYQWLIYIPLHHMRHNQQIAEVKADAGFPK